MRPSVFSSLRPYFYARVKGLGDNESTGVKDPAEREDNRKALLSGESSGDDEYVFRQCDADRRLDRNKGP